MDTSPTTHHQRTLVAECQQIRAPRAKAERPIALIGCSLRRCRAMIVALDDPGRPVYVIVWQDTETRVWNGGEMEQ